jgi:hypothetical protein
MLYDVEVIAAILLVISGLLLIGRVWWSRNQKREPERIRIALPEESKLDESNAPPA